MNALSATADGGVYDYVGGLADLQAGRVRFIGEASRRIAEDYLRILRFFRFHAAYGQGVPDPASLAACIAGRAGLAQLSRERVRAELLKLLLARHATSMLAVMAECGILGSVLGGVADLAGFENMAKVEAAAGVQADPVQRLGALGTRIAEDAERLWQRLRLSNAEHDRLASMAEAWWRISPDDDKGARALLYRLGPQRFVDRVLVAWARDWARSPRAVQDQAWSALVHRLESWVAPHFPLKAADFIKRGIAPGPALGAALHEAEEAWIAADFPVNDAAIAAIADAAAAEVRPM
jgi:poly(A) polymerase